MVVIGGQGPDGEGGLVSSQVEIYDPEKDEWTMRDDYVLDEGRFSFCAVPINSTSLMVLGGWGSSGPLSSVKVLDLETGEWSEGETMRRPRYGHTCLMTELGGRPGVMVAGGVLSGKIVEFLDINTGKWEEIASTNYKIGKLLLKIVNK